MKFGGLAARFALVVACCLATAAPAEAKFWQCATYAREISGVSLHGNAWTWWGQAEGKYERGTTPKVGAVMSFQRSARMRMGHVATVSAVISDREVLLTHANWSSRGRIERDVRAVDVSEAGDWSQVKVWFAPRGDLGLSTYAVNGFIYPGDTTPSDTLRAPAIAAKQAPVRVASLDLDLSDLAGGKSLGR